MKISELKQEYNKLLKRIDAGSKYLDDNNISVLEKEAKIPAFRRIVDNLNSILLELKKNKVYYTNEEIINGFKEE